MLSRPVAATARSRTPFAARFGALRAMWHGALRVARLAVLPVLFAAMSHAGVSKAAEPQPVSMIRILAPAGPVDFSRDELLQRRDLTTIDIPRDVTYKRPMRYRAVPLAALLEDAFRGGDRVQDATIEIVATDGFVTVLPAPLALAQEPTESAAYLAVEPEDAPWPAIPGKSVSAGPFYVVWLRPEASGIRSEQWPYMVERIGITEDPARRWPQLALDPALPVDSPIRAGRALFMTQCMACHPLNGAGNAHVGPDLGSPQSPTAYLTPTALRQLIRKPASVRSWPAMQMPGFDEEALADGEIDLIVRYLDHVATRKQG